MKNFDEWNKIKKNIDQIKGSPRFYEREIWYCNLGLNIGFEQNGDKDNFIRPVLIFKKFNKNIFWAIPLTRTKKNLKFYFNFSTKDFKSTAILSQIRLLDTKRLLNKIGFISKNQFENLKEKFKDLLP